MSVNTSVPTGAINADKALYIPTSLVEYFECTSKFLSFSPLDGWRQVFNRSLNTISRWWQSLQPGLQRAVLPLSYPSWDNTSPIDSEDIFFRTFKFGKRFKRFKRFKNLKVHLQQYTAFNYRFFWLLELIQSFFLPEQCRYWGILCSICT